MAVPAFDPKELEVVREVPPRVEGFPPTVHFATPVSYKEGYKAMLSRQAIWQPAGLETTNFCPKINPENIARAFVIDANTTSGAFVNAEHGGGPDFFGIEWEYVAQAGGSIVRPGEPLLADANDWKEKLVWPDLKSWDWAGSAELNKEYLSTTNYVNLWILNGFWFERLISFMDFEGALMALYDEDQKEAVLELFDKLADLAIELIDLSVEYFPEIDGICIHDDWGAQKETFFSPDLVAEMIVPSMKKVVDHIHAKGRFAELHSCGNIIKQVPNMIACGWDHWSPQTMNDTQLIYELYGDKIITSVIPDNAAGIWQLSEDEQKAAAQAYADKFCKPGKPSYLSGVGRNPVAFRTALYQASRENYSK